MALVSTSVAVSLTACRAEADAPRGLRIVDAWGRPAGEGATGIAYVTIENTDTVAVRITSVNTSQALAVEVHETSLDGGVARMHQLEQLDIPAGSTLVMEPGGLHLMLLELTRAMNAGDSVSLRLTRTTGETTTATVRVRTP